MTREEAAVYIAETFEWVMREYENHRADRTMMQKTTEAVDVAIAALREKAERERGCAYCVIGKRSPDAEYCSNCGRKLTPTLPELANESEEVNQDSRQYLDNDSTYRRKSVKQMGRNLYSETAETCTVTQEQPINFCKVRRGNDDHA